MIPDYIITEDSNSGYDFFLNFVGGRKDICLSASGNSGIVSILERLNVVGKNILIVIDSAAFGPHIEKLYKYIQNDFSDNTYRLLAPECFEHLLLKSAMFHNNKEVQNILFNTSASVDSEEYFSWEIFFTELLEKVTLNTPAQYNKKRLNSCYKADCCIENPKCNFFISGNKGAVILSGSGIDLSEQRATKNIRDDSVLTKVTAFNK